MSTDQTDVCQSYQYDSDCFQTEEVNPTGSCDSIDDLGGQSPSTAKDTEFATWREPYKNYPPKAWKKSISEFGKPRDRAPIDFKAIVENYLRKHHPSGPPPKWIPRFCLRRIHILLLCKGMDPDLGECLGSLYSLYEKYAPDVFVYANVDLTGTIIFLLSTASGGIKLSIFEKMMERLQRGIYMQSLSQDLVNPRKFALFFTVLGLAIVNGHPHAQKSISNILALWLENLLDKKQIKGVHSQSRCSAAEKPMKGSKHLIAVVPDSVFIEALEQSRLARLLSKCIRDGLEANMEGYLCSLSLLKHCCEASPIIWQRMISFGILDSILSKLSLPDPSNRILLSTADFMHCIFGVQSLLSQTRTPQRTLSMKKESFQALVERLIQQLPANKVKSTKDVRNNTAFLICLVCRHVPDAGNYLLDYGNLIASIISSAALGQKEDGLDLQLYSTPEDVELLQYFIYMLKHIVETTSGEEIINEYKMASILLMLLLGPCEFTTDDLRKGQDLNRATWCTMHAIAKQCPMSFISQHAAVSLLSYLKVYGDTGEGDRIILSMCMHACRSLLCTNASEEIIDYFIQHDGINTFLSVIKQLMLKDHLELVGETMTGNALLCCSVLCTSEPRQRKIFCDLDGISILTLVMQRLLFNPFDKRYLDNLLIVAVTECICSCVAYEPVCLEEFLANEGIFQLLDLLELPKDSKTTAHLMGCLLQLCAYPRCLNQLLYWSRSKKTCTSRVALCEVLGSGYTPRSGDNIQELQTPTDRCLSSLFCELWKVEEKDLNVLRDPDGCIASLTNPLMSRFSKTYEGKVQFGIIKACLDLSTPISIRHKIFVLIRSIYELAKSEASFFNGLSLPNQIIMANILNYSGLKSSEICIEIIDEMQQEEQIGSNNEADLSRILNISRNKVATVIELQRFLLRRHKEKEATTEHEFYSLIKQCQLQDHLMAVKEIDYLARTTNYQFLVEKRLWQKCELEGREKDLNSSFIKTSKIHRTSGGHLNITAWTSRTRYIESEPPTNKEDFSLADFEDNNYQQGSEGDGLSAKPISDKGTRSPSQLSGTPSNNVPITASEIAGGTPDPLEGGFYQISPILLQAALEKLQNDTEGQDWVKEFIDQDEENGWRIRSKWKQDWYPLDD